jgi:hypothetical protein
MSYPPMNCEQEQFLTNYQRMTIQKIEEEMRDAEPNSLSRQYGIIEIKHRFETGNFKPSRDKDNNPSGINNPKKLCENFSSEQEGK